MKKIGKETSPIRLAGQRSITASLPFGSSDRSCVSQTGSPGGNRNISLSDFLSRKLHKSVVLPETDKDKQKLSSSVVFRRNFSGPLILQNGETNLIEVEKNFVLDKSVFDKFKPDGNGIDGKCVGSSIADDVDSRIRDHGDVRESNKREAPFQFGSEFVTAKKRVIVIGDDPRPCSCINKLFYKKIEQSVTHFNHYANGKGWWDSNMEGVDNDEVGACEVWEGVGSSTIGGLDWH